MTRSEIMSRIRSRGNKSTELAFTHLLRRRKIAGWRRHLKVAGIRPDFVFPKMKVAVFIDGCFWHGCSEHARLGRLSTYWIEKITRNMKRDAEQTIVLRNAGWAVERIWEHSLKGVR